MAKGGQNWKGDLGGIFSDPTDEEAYDQMT